MILCNIFQENDIQNSWWYLGKSRDTSSVNNWKFIVGGVLIGLDIAYINRLAQERRNSIANALYTRNFISHIDGLVQERCNSIANALELHLVLTHGHDLRQFAISTLSLCPLSNALRVY